MTYVKQVFIIFLMKVKKEIPRQTFTTRIDPNLVTELKHMAADRKKPVNHLLEEAVKDFLRVDPRLIAELDLLATNQKKSVNDLVEEAVKEFLKKRASKK